MIGSYKCYSRVCFKGNQYISVCRYLCKY
ncbi:unnamed protein product [Spirodela intermedia]|uniref:Uncharacterized protein n=1 Tax=Spirodela intermedia TaxID=51605 RepID=A0A7I8L695_SPIIN|nr:unnamed protein product [Spirodela intermedia]